jgi:hypothetical protein
MNHVSILGILFGPIGNATPKRGTGASAAATLSEGDVHSGPGGYEDGSYQGGYAADYFEGEHEES